MVLKIKYIIGSLLICLSVQLTANNEVSYLKKEQVDTCFSKFKTEYKSLFRAIDRINMSYSDNYLHVLFVYNYDFDTNTNTKQWNILSSVLSASETAIENAREKDITYCPDIAKIYIMNAVALLYQKHKRYCLQSNF